MARYTLLQFDWMLLFGWQPVFLATRRVRLN